MKRGSKLAVGGLALAVVASAAVWLARRKTDAPIQPTGPDADGFVWTVIDDDPDPISLRAAPLPPPASKPVGPIYEGVGDWIAPRAAASFSADGSQLTVDLYNLQDKHERLVFALPGRQLVSHQQHVPERVPLPPLSFRDADAGGDDGGPRDAGTRDGGRGCARPLPEVSGGRLTFDTGEEVFVPSAVLTMVWGPDENTLAIVLTDSVLTWGKEDGLARLDGAPSDVRNGICSPDGTKMVTGGLRVVDLLSGSVTPLRLVSDTYPSYMLEREAHWRAGGAEVDVGMGGSGVYRFDPATGRALGDPTRPVGRDDWSVRAVDGAWGFAKWIPYGRDYAIFRVESGAPVLEMENIGSGASEASVAASDDGRWLASWMSGRLEVRDFQTHQAWVVGAGAVNETLSLHGTTLLASTPTVLELWDVEKRERKACVKLPANEGPVLRHGLSRAGDRFFLPSGRIVSLADRKVVSDGPAALRRKSFGYSGGCWGPNDRFLALVDGDAIVLYRISDGAELVLYQLVTGSGVEVLAVSPKGEYDASDALLATVWFNERGTAKRAKDTALVRRVGLLRAFHAGL